MPAYEDRLKDYVDVKERIRLFYEKYPDGRLTTGEVSASTEPDGVPRIWVQALAYRTPDDPHPAVGLVLAGPPRHHELHPRERTGEHRDERMGPCHRCPRHRHRQVHCQRQRSRQQAGRQADKARSCRRPGDVEPVRDARKVAR